MDHHFSGFKENRRAAKVRLRDISGTPLNVISTLQRFHSLSISFTASVEELFNKAIDG